MQSSWHVLGYNETICYLNHLWLQFGKLSKLNCQIPNKLVFTILWCWLKSGTPMPIQSFIWMGVCGCVSVCVAEGNGTPLQYSCLEKSHGRRSLVGCDSWGRWVGHARVTSLSLFTFLHRRKKWKPTPVFLPGEPRDGETSWAAFYGVVQSWTWLKWLSSSSLFQAYDSL